MSGWTTGEETTPDAISGRIVLTDELVRQALKEQSGLKWWHLGYLLPVVFFAVWPVFKADDGQRLVVVALPVVFLVVLLVFLIVLRFRIAGKYVMENKTDAERQLTFHFDASGYRITTPVSTASAQWSSVHRTREGATTFFVYPASNICQIVPKSAFAEPDVARLRALLAEHVLPRPTRYDGAGQMKKTLILWVVLIFMFLLIWQLLDGGGSGDEAQPSSAIRTRFKSASAR